MPEIVCRGQAWDLAWSKSMTPQDEFALIYPTPKIVLRPILGGTETQSQQAQEAARPRRGRDTTLATIVSGLQALEGRRVGD